MDRTKKLKKFLIILNFSRGFLFLVEGLLFLSFIWPPINYDAYSTQTAIEIATFLFSISIVEISFAFLGFRKSNLSIKLNHLLFSMHTLLLILYFLYLGPIGLTFFGWEYYWIVIFSWILLNISSPFILILIIKIRRDS